MVRRECRSNGQVIRESLGRDNILNVPLFYNLAELEHHKAMSLEPNMEDGYLTVATRQQGAPANKY
ncbi:hypothetical protein, partial [Pseudomonas sp. TSPC2-1]|uniref:hypothetical protein n=1 Tax=Pseudomonas sp. TSPC2-1 TaxID=2804663 RepID=UPI003CEC3CEE